MNLSPSESPICYLTPRRLALSAWIEHVPFGMFLIELMRPSSIVELGTRKGVSYSAFCQAVEKLGLPTRCVAVDSWHGDAHTGAYGPRVLAELRLHHDPLYSGFSRLLQSSFDAAAAGFEPGSIDLLHIDGFHTYEAVSHDFHTWLPKMSTRGVVLLHDVAERHRDFGVWRLWAELAGRYPSFMFRHGHGLGVLGVGAELPTPVRDLLALSEADAEQVRRFFHSQGRRVARMVLANFIFNSPARLMSAVAARARSLRLGPASGA